MKSYFTIMVRKACDHDHLLKNTNELITKFGSQPQRIKINKTVELPADEFEVFKNNLLNVLRAMNGLISLFSIFYLSSQPFEISPFQGL